MPAQLGVITKRYLKRNSVRAISAIILSLLIALAPMEALAKPQGITIEGDVTVEGDNYYETYEGDNYYETIVQNGRSGTQADLDTWNYSRIAYGWVTNGGSQIGTILIWQFNRIMTLQRELRETREELAELRERIEILEAR